MEIFVLVDSLKNDLSEASEIASADCFVGVFTTLHEAINAARWYVDDSNELYETDTTSVSILTSRLHSSFAGFRDYDQRQTGSTYVWESWRENYGLSPFVDERDESRVRIGAIEPPTDAMVEAYKRASTASGGYIDWDDAVRAGLAAALATEDRAEDGETGTYTNDDIMVALSRIQALLEQPFMPVMEVPDLAEQTDTSIHTTRYSPEGLRLGDVTGKIDLDMAPLVRYVTLSAEDAQLLKAGSETGSGDL